MATLTAGTGNFMTAGTWTPSQVPTAADDCLLTASSGAVTIDAGSVCRSLNLTGYTNTLTHTAGVTLTIGDATAGLTSVALAFPTSGWTYTLGSTTTSAISFVSTSATQQTVNFGGQTTGNVTFNAASNGSWKYTGTHVIGPSTGTLTLTKGSLDLNGQTVTVGIFDSNNTNTRSLTLGAAAITLNRATGGGAWAFNVITGLTFSGASSTITVTAGNFNSNGLTYGTVVLTGLTQTIGIGANTFGTLTITGQASKLGVYTLGANQTVSGTFTVAGNSVTNRVLITSDVLGTARTITAAVVTASNVDLRDITGAGAATWNLSAITGGSGDCGGNSLQALGSAGFTTAATQTATGTASFTWSTHGWTSRVPLPQDDAVINNAFVAGRTVTLDMPRAGKSISWAGATGTPAWAVTTATTLYGSITKIAGMTQSGTTSVTFEGRGSFTFTNAGIGWTNPLIIAMVSGTLTLNDAIVSTSTFTHNNGTFVDAGFASTFTTFTSNSGLTRVVTRTGNMTVTSTGAVFTVTTTGLTWTGTGSTITISDTSSSSKTFAGGGLTTYGTLSITGSGTGSVDITGANTFAGMTVGAPKTIRFTAATTTTFSAAPTLVGSSGNVITISSITAATHTLSLASGIVAADWLSLTNSIATGGASWYAGKNSTNVSGNTGWIFASYFTATLTATLTSVGAVTKTTTHLLTATITSAGAVINSLTHLLASTLTSNGQLTQAATHLLAGTLTSAGILTKSVSRVFTATLASVGTVSKTTTHSLTATMSGVGVLVKGVTKSLTSNLTSSGGFRYSLARLLNATLTLMGVTLKTRLMVITATLASGSAVHILSSRVFNATLAFVGVLTSNSLGHLARVMKTSGDALRRAGAAINDRFE